MYRFLSQVFGGCESTIDTQGRMVRTFFATDFASPSLQDDGSGKYQGLECFSSFDYMKATEELLWKLQGHGDLKTLLKKDIHVWTPFAFYCYDAMHNDGESLSLYATASKEEYSERMKARMKIFEVRILDDDGFAEEWGMIGTTSEEISNFIMKKKERYKKNYFSALGNSKKSNLSTKSLLTSLESLIEVYRKDYLERTDDERGAFDFNLPIPPVFPEMHESLLLLNGSFKLKTDFNEEYEFVCASAAASRFDMYREFPYAYFQLRLLQVIIAHFAQKKVGDVDHTLWCPYLLNKDFYEFPKACESLSKTHFSIYINPEVSSLKDLKSEDIIIENIALGFVINFTGRGVIPLPFLFC